VGKGADADHTTTTKSGDSFSARRDDNNRIENEVELQKQSPKPKAVVDVVENQAKQDQKEIVENV